MVSLSKAQIQTQILYKLQKSPILFIPNKPPRKIKNKLHFMSLHFRILRMLPQPIAETSHHIRTEPFSLVQSTRVAGLGHEPNLGVGAGDKLAGAFLVLNEVEDVVVLLRLEPRFDFFERGEAFCVLVRLVLGLP
jgi:hypothetical protein